VIDKPAGSEITQWWLCYIANKGVAAPAAMAAPAPEYKEEGVSTSTT